jgi:hypothetical protein
LFGRAAGVVVAFVLLLMIFAAGASAATRTWDGGCGEDTSWSCAANWSEDTVPGAADTAILAGAGNSTVDASFEGTVASVILSSGYAGTLSLERSLTATVAFSQEDGSFTAAGQALSVGALTVKYGSFTASSATTSVSGSLKIRPIVTFDANGGTFDFTGTTTASLSCGEVTFNHVVFTHTAGFKTIGPNCTLPLGAEPLANAGGSLRVNGTLTGSGTLTTSGALILVSKGVLSGFTGLVANRLIVGGPYDFGEYAPFTVGDNLIVRSSAEFTAPAGTAVLGGNFAVAGGASFAANGGTLEFTSSEPFKLSCGSHALSLVVFESTGHKSINGNCTLPLGGNPSLGGGGTLLKGTLQGSGELTQEGNFVISSPEPGLSSFTDVTDTGYLKLTSSAAVVAPSGTLTVNGDFLVSLGATFEANGGTVNFEALSSTKNLVCSGIAFNLVTLTNVGRVIVASSCNLPLGASPTLGAGGAIVLNGDLTGSGALTAESASLSLSPNGSLTGFSGFSASGIVAVSGTYDFGEYTTFEVASNFQISPGSSFTAPAGTAKFGGNFNNVGPSFAANGGTVELIGTNQHISGSTTFFNLTKVAGAEDTVTFKGGDTQTIAGTLTLEGASAGEHLSLVSSEPGLTSWKINAESATVKWATVSDSLNLGTTISATESTDGGGNAGWEFP